jgi:hypothetical protein
LLKDFSSRKNVFPGKQNVFSYLLKDFSSKQNVPASKQNVFSYWKNDGSSRIASQNHWHDTCEVAAQEPPAVLTTTVRPGGSS